MSTWGATATGRTGQIADAQARGLRILPVCPYFSAYLQKHPEHAEAVHPTYRGVLGI